MYSKTKILFLCLSVFFIAGGCINFKQPRNRVQHYLLEYATPEIKGLKPLSVSLKMERFSVAPAYNTNRIIYRDASFKRDEYFYHKWRANPGDMVTYFLSRDIRNSGLFKAVLPQGSDFPFSCVLEGSVNEFVEWDGPEGWNAVLGVTVTLMAANEPDISKRILFQKSYRVEKPFTEKNPQGLAQAMSLAMRDISTNIIKDIYGVLKNWV
ncbi:MAG: membrane integrity-associated transporter subunit PqiC [Deltaproteobacteria bacterium]|nr:membrane integrity-associated transporter subunit PqiC [Deltaproteobacteria bacterium]